MTYGLSDFVKQYTKKGSISVNQAGVIAFLCSPSIYGPQRKVEKGKFTKKEQLKIYEKLSIQYIEDISRDRLKDATDFATSLAGVTKERPNGYPPMTARSRLSVIRNFFSFNNIEFTNKQWDKAAGKLPKGGSRTVEQEIDVLVVRKILEHADLKMTSLGTFLVSTGARLNEALSIHINDITFDGDGIAKVTIRGELTKTGDTRECYCSTEAVRYLKEWLRIRPSYMESAAKKGIGKGKKLGKGIQGKRPDPESDNRLFPFTDHVAISSWNNVVKRAGYGDVDRTTKRRTMHLHMLRKLFRTQLALKIPVDVCEALMGHRVYLSQVYRTHTKRQVREMYTKGSSVLHIFGDADISDVKEQLDSTSKILEATRMDGEQTAKAQSMLVIENTQLKTQLESMRSEIEYVKKEMIRFNGIVDWIQESDKFKKYQNIKKH